MPNSLSKRTRQYSLLPHTWSLMIWTDSLVLISGVAVGHFALCFMSSKMGIALFPPYLAPTHRVFQGNLIENHCLFQGQILVHGMSLIVSRL